MFKLSKIIYSELNSRQKENYNFHQIAGILSGYGYNCLRLSDDWDGADFIAIHIDGKSVLRVQLKGRMSFRKVYQSKNLYIAFPSGSNENVWYLYPHDELLPEFEAGFALTSSWCEKGSYSFPNLSKKHNELLTDYRICK